MDLLERIVTAPLAKAGVVVNGPHPYGIQVHHSRVYSRVFWEGTLGLGESYVDGDWDCEDLAELINRCVGAGLDRDRIGFSGRMMNLLHAIRNEQSKRLSRRVAEKHYDLDNDLYQLMLDPSMAYTCAYYGRGAQTLAEAQRDKLRLVCEKIDLQPGQRVLDIGCGWGSFAKFAAEEFGAKVVGITIANEQISLGDKLCEGLPVTLRYMDYRDIPKHFERGHFDHVVSIGMFEAVGPKNFRAYMEAARWAVKEAGLFLLHTIGNNLGGFDPWIERYIFPGGVIPSMDQIVQSSKEFFVKEDVHNFGADYARTLQAWRENFETRAWPILKTSGRYDERFYRMWEYYLQLCEGTFKARALQLWQIVLSPHGVKGGYRRVS